MLAKFIARGFDENRESGLVREWSFGAIQEQLPTLRLARLRNLGKAQSRIGR
jgi:hypothetical protein